MKSFELLFKGNKIKLVHGVIFLLLCGTRLGLQVTNIVYIQFLFSMVIFLILPIGLWFYLQKTTLLFSSCFVRVRLRHLKLSSYFLNVLVNDIITAFYVFINALIIFMITFDFSEFEFIIFFVLITLYWLCIYLLFLNLFHLIYYFSKDLKSAFFSSYFFLFFLSFGIGVLSDNLFNYENAVYADLSFSITVSIVILLFTHMILFLFGKGKCEVYDKDKI